LGQGLACANCITDTGWPVGGLEMDWVDQVRSRGEGLGDFEGLGFSSSLRERFCRSGVDIAMMLCWPHISTCAAARRRKATIR
jgi:hypothetical protein